MCTSSQRKGYTDHNVPKILLLVLIYLENKKKMVRFGNQVLNYKSLELISKEI